MMNVVNYGGEKGIFIHEIPEYSQWISDPTVRVALPRGFQGLVYVCFSLHQTDNLLLC